MFGWLQKLIFEPLGFGNAVAAVPAVPDLVAVFAPRAETLAFSARAETVVFPARAESLVLGARGS